MLDRGTLGLLMLVTAACSPLRYVATAPPRGTVSGDSGEASATVIVAEIHAESSATRYRLETDAPAGARLGMVYLNGAYEPRCSPGGVRAVLMQIDGEERWSGDPVPIDGRHRLDVDFNSNTDVGPPGPRAIDIELSGAGGTRCLRVPLRQSSAPEAGWRQTNTANQGFGTDADIPFHAVSGVTALIAIRYELGLWVGPVRLAVQPGPIGIATCSTAICGSDEQGQGKSAPMLPLGGGITAYPWTSGLFALGAEARIRESFVWLPAETGTQRFWIHSPQGVVHFAIAPPTAGDGLPGGPKLFSADFEVPAGALIVRREGRTLTAPMLGFGLMIHTWL
jgi:hypothetical protein